MSAHSARLQHAMKDLRDKWNVTLETWEDQVAQDFEKNHLAPLEGLVKRNITGIFQHPDGEDVREGEDGVRTPVPEAARRRRPA